MPFRLTVSVSSAGSGTTESIATTISGDVPQLTCGAKADVSISTTSSNRASGSLTSVRQ